MRRASARPRAAVGIAFVLECKRDWHYRPDGRNTDYTKQRSGLAWEFPAAACRDVPTRGSQSRRVTARVFAQWPELDVRIGRPGHAAICSKDSAGAEVVDAVRVVHAGRRYLSPKIASTVIDDYISERQRASPLDSLSRRERQILQLVAEGKSSAEAAAMLFLSPKTVDTYRSRMITEIGHCRRAEPVKFAIQHGVTQLD